MKGRQSENKEFTLVNKLRIAQNSFNGEQWMFESPKRNHFKKKCSSHAFCGVEYDLKPAHSSIDQKYEKDPIDFNLSKNCSQQYMQNISEEGLDDWMAQSMNRSILSLLNPKKKMEGFPTSLLEDMKIRYSNIRLKGNESNDLYFEDNDKPQSSKQNLELPVIFDSNKLNPQQIDGDSILIKEEMKLKSNQKEVQKRYGRYLSQDIYYLKFTNESSNKMVQDQQVKQQNDKSHLNIRENKILSLNAPNYLGSELGQSSIVDNEILKLNSNLKKQLLSKKISNINYKVKIEKMLSFHKKNQFDIHQSPRDNIEQFHIQQESLIQQSQSQIIDNSNLLKNVFVKKKKGLLELDKNEEETITDTKKISNSKIKVLNKQGQSMAHQMLQWYKINEEQPDSEYLPYIVDHKLVADNLKYEQRQFLNENASLSRGKKSISMHIKKNQLEQKNKFDLQKINDCDIGTLKVQVLEEYNLFFKKFGNKIRKGKKLKS